MGDAVKAVDRLGNVAKDILDELEKVRAKLIGTTAALEIERAARKRAQSVLRLFAWKETGFLSLCSECHKTRKEGHVPNCSMDAALKGPS